ncbi:hypothetical protein ACFYXS_02030 [Streptomyces sp. NPDC002574]|uniref:hypothetical protein n=1 Tax=Streptomyces sp. NPDC002574 TaxID=3364652 RepID=UPI0036B8A2B7
MSNPTSDNELWDAFVAAKRELHRCQADFYQNAQNRPGILKAALSGGPWQRGTALDFLRSFADDGLELLPQLIELSMSHGWAMDARQAVDNIPRDRLLPALDPLITAQLETADDDEYRRLAELLAHIRAWLLLQQLIRHAQASKDPDVCEVADDFTAEYGVMWAPKPSGTGLNL